MRPEEARRRFATARVARLATVAADGAPHLVPIVFALLDDTVYSVVDEKPKRTAELKRLRNVRANPKAALLADHYEEDWTRLWWVRADGTARTLESDEPEAQRALAALAQRYPQQRPIGPVLAVDVERWTGWSAGGST
ncbi:MAG: TIGR03668 family PPOX class F420-dependent oxidoreductase [Solirubrobacterales bacterium]